MVQGAPHLAQDHLRGPFPLSTAAVRPFFWALGDRSSFGGVHQRRPHMHGVPSEIRSKALPARPHDSRRTNLPHQSFADHRHARPLFLRWPTVPVVRPSIRRRDYAQAGARRAAGTLVEEARGVDAYLDSNGECVRSDRSAGGEGSPRASRIRAAPRRILHHLLPSSRSLELALLGRHRL